MDQRAMSASTPFSLVDVTSDQAQSSATSGTEQPASFSVFPQLPPELRLKIWGMLDDEPRYINARRGYLFDSNSLATLAGKTSIEHKIWYSQRIVGTIPVLAHICTETRKELVAHYRTFALLALFNFTPKMFSINPTIDTLCFDSFRDIARHLKFAERRGASTEETNLATETRHILVVDYESYFLRSPLPSIFPQTSIVFGILIGFKTLRSVTVLVEVPDSQMGSLGSLVQTRWTKLWEGKGTKPMLILKRDVAMATRKSLERIERGELQRGFRPIRIQH